jgi:hypothetical protein
MTTAVQLVRQVPWLLVGAVCAAGFLLSRPKDDE